MRTKLQFHIDGAYITDLVRQVWVEGAMSKALHIMKSGFPHMSPDDRLAVCTGKKKLVGVDVMTLEPDDVTEVCGIKILSFEEQVAKRERELDRCEVELRLSAEIEAGETELLPSPWGLVCVPCSLVEWERKGPEMIKGLRDMEWDEFEARFPDLVAEARMKLEAQIEQRRIDDALRISGLDPERVKAAQAAMLDTVMSTPEGKPEPDEELVSMNGWIDPEGNLYGCEYMGHITLAHRLDLTEGLLEKRRWVKLQDSRDPRSIIPREGDDFYISDAGVTQAQYDTMWAWCQKHNRAMPEHVEVR